MTVYNVCMGWGGGGDSLWLLAVMQPQRIIGCLCRCPPLCRDFQLIVLVLRPPTLLLCFCLISSISRQLFSAKKKKKEEEVKIPLCVVCVVPKDRQMTLVTSW